METPRGTNVVTSSSPKPWELGHRGFPPAPYHTVVCCCCCFPRLLSPVFPTQKPLGLPRGPEAP